MDERRFTHDEARSLRQIVKQMEGDINKQIDVSKLIASAKGVNY